MAYLIVFAFGAIVGSFLNVCIYRLPKGQSVAFPGSHCPKCKHAIRWYDNIPILSYILLVGRCAHCRTKIPMQYIVVETVTALLAVGLYMGYGLTPKFSAYAVMTAGLIVATFVDLATYEIPDEISLGGIAAGLAFAVAFPAVFDTASRLSAAIESALGIVAGGGSIYLLGLAGAMAFRKEAMGGGDVKLMAAIGAFIGWKMALLAFFIAPLFGAGFGLILKVRDGKEIMPYGPFLSLGALVAVFFGDKILQIIFYVPQ